MRYAAGAMGDQDGTADSDARAGIDSMLQIADEILRTGDL